MRWTKAHQGASEDSRGCHCNKAGEDKVEEEEDDEDEDEDMSDVDDDEDAMSVTTPSLTTTSTVSNLPPTPTKEVPEEIEELRTASSDNRPFPRPFESLRDFFARTSSEWQTYLLKDKPSITSEQTLKELRKKAFTSAEERWWDAREEVMALEDEQEAQGIGEVVNIGDRGADAGVGRRR